MASENFKLKVFTPAGLLLDEQVTSVYLPSSQGEIGVLPMHTKYTGLLGTGVASYTPISGTEGRRMVISGGFCTFSQDIFTILADSVDFAETVNRSNYASEGSELTKTLGEMSALDPRWEYTRQKLARIEAIDRLLAH